MTGFEIISLLAAVGIFAGLYNLGKKIGGLEENVKSIKDSLRHLPCEQHQCEIKAIRDDVVVIKTFLATKYKDMGPVWGIKHSPTSLNGNGKLLLNQIDGEDFLLQYKDFFLKKLAAKNPQTVLDVELEANFVLLESVNDDIFNNIKNWVCDSSPIQIEADSKLKEYSATMVDVCYVLSLPLRDLYLSLHPEISVRNSSNK